MWKLPEELHSANQLGAKLDSFRPMMANIAAGFILGTLAFVAGVAAIVLPLRQAYLADWDLPFESKHGWCWMAIILSGGIGVVLVVVGVVLTIYSRTLLGRRVDLHENGLMIITREGRSVVPWDQVEVIQELILYERPPILEGPARLLIPHVKSVSYIIHVKSERKFHFDGDAIRAIHRFGKVLRSHAEPKGISWNTVEQ